MTLNNILNSIDEIIKSHQGEKDTQLLSKLRAHIEINELIQRSAPYFNQQETTEAHSTKEC